MMMSLEMDLERKIAEELLAAQDIFDTIGFEIIGTKDINDEFHYIVKKKNS